MRLEQLPPGLRARVEAKLAEEDSRRRGAAGNAARTAARIAPDAPDARGDTGTTPRPAKRATGGGARARRAPNKTEARYAAEVLRGLDARYEALTFRLANGHRYTPDWVVFDSAGRLLSCHEVKGAHRFHSHQRARLAFDQAATEFPGLTWFWATLTKNGWEKHHA